MGFEHTILSEVFLFFGMAGRSVAWVECRSAL